MEAGVKLTDVINRALAGDETAMQSAFDATYVDLRRLARLRLSRAPRGALLDTTSLVHESFLRFAKAGEISVQDRAHFLRYASQAMRSVIVDTVRRRAAVRHGGDLKQVELTTNLAGQVSTGETEILEIHEALEALAQHDARMVQVVEMRYFAGMTEPEVAQALNVSDRTVRRIWERARVWLAAALDQG